MMSEKAPNIAKSNLIKLEYYTLDLELGKLLHHSIMLPIAIANNFFVSYSLFGLPILAHAKNKDTDCVNYNFNACKLVSWR